MEASHAFLWKTSCKGDLKILKCTYIVYICIFWIWRVRNHVTRQIGEYEICLASMKSKSLAILASMHFPLCRTLIYIADVQRRGFSLIDQKMSKLRGFELRRIWDILGYLYNTLSTTLWYEASVLRFWHTVTEYILQICNVEVSVWSTKKWWNDRGMNLDKFDIFLGICTTQKDYANIVTLWGLRCVDEYVRTTGCERFCEKDVVRKTVWERHSEKDVVRKMVWETRWEKDVVRKILFFTCFF